MDARPNERPDEGPDRGADPSRDRVRRKALALAAAGRASPLDAQQDVQRAWHELLTGGWALVDHFEHGGRRYLVARRRPPSGGQALTPAETACALLAAMGRSQKVIAHELGIRASTTSTHVRRAMRKLGLGRPTELVRVLGAGLPR